MKSIEPVKTLEELIDFVAFGDIHEAGYTFKDDPEGYDYAQIRLPYNRPDELKPGGAGISPEEEMHFDILAILIAFKEKRLAKGGWVMTRPWDEK
jgi:hypothetical protein